ncbi:MAG TPA: autotransporter assembly complex family protein [Caulobacteraceae bacterium]
MTAHRLAAAAGAATTLLAAAGAAWCDVPKARIEGVNDTRLRQEIERALGTAKNPPQSRFEARRRAEAAAADVMAVLRSEGYYEAVVAPDVGQGDQPASVVNVTPGPRFTIADPQVVWDKSPPVAQVQLAGKAAIGLTIGGPGRAADVLGAEGRVAAAAQKRGYADAKVEPRVVTVDHMPRTVQPTFHIDAGDRVMMDGIHLSTGGRTKPSWAGSLAPWKVGDVYDPDQVAELEKRLRDTGVYDSVTVSLDPKPDADGRRPVDVTLVDRPRSTLELGATYSTADNSGVDGKWTRYNWLGRGDTLIISTQVANILSQAGVELDLPNWRRALQTLKLSTSLYRDNTNAYLETGYRVGGEVQQRYGRDDFHTYGVTLDLSRDEEPQVENGLLIHKVRPLATIATSVLFSWDRSDDILNPKQGWRFQIQGEPTFSAGSGPIAYLRAQASASAYEPFDMNGDTVLAERVHFGSIINGSIPAIPASRRFYSGGGGSVRGYGYQDVGPRFPNNSPEGGISLIESSVELRRKIAGPFGVAMFVDSGVLSTEHSFDFKQVSTGVGVGLRYDLGFAPLRADIAVPVARHTGDSSVQIYLSIGQSF